MARDIRKAQEFASAQFSYRAQQFRSAARATLRGAQRYSVFVRIMKGALPLTALGLGILVLVYLLQPPPSRMQMAFQRLSKLADDLAMDNPRLSGSDENGQPFVISARRATPGGSGADRVDLQDIVADFSLKDGTGIHLTAAGGLVDAKSRVLNLSGGVHITAQNGYDAWTPSAVADLRRGTVQGEKGIVASGGFGHITAQRFAMNRDTRQFRFWGDIHMLLNPNDFQKQQGKSR